MNERIKLLAEQAMSGVQEEAYPEERSWSMDDVMEKFAELIVRECAGVAFDEYAATNGAASGESAILKHFGVEE